MPCWDEAAPAPAADRPLNPTLHGLLRDRFGRVAISARGERAITGPAAFSPQRGRSETTFAHEGEYYRVNCPYCNDAHQRLYVNHLWNLVDPLNGRPMRHLVICYNGDCMKAHYADFEEHVFGMTSAEQRKAMRGMSVANVVGTLPEARALGPVEPPGAITPLSGLPRGHVALVYLDDRGFDAAELEADWGVGFCARAPRPHEAAAGRIFMPVRFRGDMVGWQARWPAEDWKNRGVQKYYNLAGFKKSSVLYGHDRARAHPCVIVVEGVTDAWAVGDGAVALLGKTVSQAQLHLLAEWARGLLVMMLDPGAWTDEQRNPEAARFKHDLLLATLRNVFDGRVVEVALPPGRDPGQLARGPLRRLVRDQVKAAGHRPKKYDL